MKVKCINNNCLSPLTIGKQYMVTSKLSNSYEVLCDDNLKRFIIKDRFEIIEETYDLINPQHYKQGDKETWEKMVDIWGKEAFIKHCEITAFKYIQRLGAKPNNSIENDLEKARWYLNKAYELKQQ